MRAEMLRVRETYGNAAILDASRTGSQSMLHGRAGDAAVFAHVRRLHRSVVQHVGRGGSLLRSASPIGEKDYKSAGREPTDFDNSKLILMWGWSPGDGTFGTGTMQYLKHAKQRGTRIICVDPRRHD